MIERFYLQVKLQTSRQQNAILISIFNEFRVKLFVEMIFDDP